MNLNIREINRKLVEEGRDQRYIDGFWAGYRLMLAAAHRGLGEQLYSDALHKAAADASFMLIEEQRAREKRGMPR